MDISVIENIVIVGSLAYLVSYVANIIEEKYKPPVVSVQQERLNTLYGRTNSERTVRIL